MNKTQTNWHPEFLKKVEERYGRPPTEKELQKIKENIKVYTCDGGNVSGFINSIIDSNKEKSTSD